MNNARFFCYYKHDGQDILLEGKTSEYLDAEYSVNENSINLTLKPKDTVDLVWARFEFDYNFNEDDKFFANGYQSWSLSREYSKDDLQKSSADWLKIFKADKFAGLASEMWVCDKETKKGVFHSHCYTYIKNNRNYYFIGSLSEKNGFTIIGADLNSNKLYIAKDVEGAKIDKDTVLYDIAVLTGSEDEVFNKYFDLMGVKKPKIDHLSGYTSWYNYFQKINEDIIIRDLNAMDIVKDDVNIFQIDDGYETFVGDWLDPNPSKFPNGMKYMVDKIHDKGYMAGLWLAPFNVQIRSRTYKEHPDWVVKNKKGKPVLGCQGWGGTYTLDIYNPEVKAYIKNVFDTVLNDWGFDMVKLDFLYSECMVPRNGKSRGEIMCEAMDFLRECCGDKLILGCGVPLGAAFGRVDACRISCDVDLHYKDRFYAPLNLSMELPSAKNAINNSLFRRQLNNRVFVNDPDVFFLRYSNIKFTIEQKILLGFINHICGDVLFVSDNMQEYKSEDIKAVKQIFAKSDFKILDVNYIENDKKIVINLLDKDSNERVVWFSVDTGMGNYHIVSKLYAKR